WRGKTHTPAHAQISAVGKFRAQNKIAHPVNAATDESINRSDCLFNHEIDAASKVSLGLYCCGLTNANIAKPDQAMSGTKPGLAKADSVIPWTIANNKTRAVKPKPTDGILPCR